MRVSVVVCTYALEMYDAFVEAGESVLAQTYDDVELVVVVDGNEAVYERASGDFGGRSDVVIHCNDENRGLSVSRNRGVRLASGDVVAFLDDDAVADERWVEELVSTYETEDAIAVGGRMVPDWVAGEPAYLPQEFYWLVGVTHRGFADGPGEVRNTFGSNISFRREVFEELGGFDPAFGRQGEKNLQAEETEFCARMRAEFGEGVYYNPDAVVAHKVFDYRTRKRWLLERAFWQGYSKRALDTLLSGRSDTADADAESAYLKRLFGRYVPERIGSLVRSPSVEKATQLAAIFVLTGAVGAGYLYGTTDW